MTLAYSSRLDQLYSREILDFIRDLPVGTSVWWDGSRLVRSAPQSPAPRFMTVGDHLVPYKERNLSNAH